MLAELCLALLGWIGGDGRLAQKGDAATRSTYEALVEQAHDPKPDRRRSAIRALAEFQTPAAWAVVLEALTDRESAVADAAQLVAGRIADPKVALELFGPLGLGSKEDQVALRAAEVLGRIAAPVDGERLARELSTRHPELSRILVWSIERLAERQKLFGRADKIADALARLYESRGDHGLACAALLALARVAPERARPLSLEALADRAPERRCAAALVFARARTPDALAAGIALAADSDVRVRMRGIECLDSLALKPALLALIARLGEEPRIRLRWRIVDVLQSSSGLKNRLDPRPWKLWAEQLPEGGVLRRGPPPKVSESDPRATRAGGFAGLTLISDRVTFLFDFSGSMWTAIEDGRLPKDIVAEKLRVALESLPEGTEFNLIPYTNVPIPWAEELRPAKKGEVQRALEFFAACRERGRGNVYDAALVALADPRCDTIVVLTDGVPTGGVHSDMDVIAPLFLERTRFRPLVVDTILVDAPPAAVRRWQELSRATGGRSIEVDLGQDSP